MSRNTKVRRVDNVRYNATMDARQAMEGAEMADYQFLKEFTELKRVAAADVDAHPALMSRAL